MIKPINLQKFGEMARLATTEAEKESIITQAVTEIRQYVSSAQTQAEREKVFGDLIEELETFFRNWLAQPVEA
jgi:Asp-tRNA(Asn)/Glu-tRNA(Gln) amidotransferase C subunit